MVVCRNGISLLAFNSIATRAHASSSMYVHTSGKELTRTKDADNVTKNSMTYRRMAKLLLEIAGLAQIILSPERTK